MSEQSVNQSPAANDTVNSASSQRKRGSRRKSSSVGRGFSRLLDAEVEFFGGLAEAAGSGLRAFGEELPERDSASSADWTRTLVGGVSKGSATFLEDLSKVVRRTSDILLEEDEEQSDSET
jgi:hypothetical protein